MGWLYPAYCSYKALQLSPLDAPEEAEKELNLWMVYWIVFAAFSILELIADLVLFWYYYSLLAKSKGLL